MLVHMVNVFPFKSKVDPFVGSSWCNAINVGKMIVESEI